MEPIQYIDQQIREHIHNGNSSQVVDFDDIFGYTEPINVISATIATTGNTDTYFIAPRTMRLFQVDFSATSALAASDTNYITWTVTNLGQTGAGTTVMLATAPTGINTTKVTGGAAIVADSKYVPSVSGLFGLVVAHTRADTNSVNNLNVIQGDRIRIRAAVTGTLANTVTFPVYMLQFN